MLGFEDFFKDMESTLGRLPSALGVRRFPDIDYIETPTQYVVQADVPGFAKDKLSVHYEAKEKLLCLSGEGPVSSFPDEEPSQCTALMSERFRGKFRRCFPVPEPVDQGKVIAKHANGVLQIQLPKTNPVTPKSFSGSVSIE
eukprot:NODE_5008_length_740_cov_25.215630_g4200_i0.p2 GENE.NODE_5008_length_740_cov_25.215630_g4200_i0~~NODE_5008_length_740_cov_25.215630_g4200_i0.p2  ORF type:complete len:142 (+),score=30.19 NODE_5008_length_740_cov_25.215630_g4200_i0:172-597(+)